MKTRDRERSHPRGQRADPESGRDRNQPGRDTETGRADTVRNHPQRIKVGGRWRYRERKDRGKVKTQREREGERRNSQAAVMVETRGGDLEKDHQT